MDHTVVAKPQKRPLFGTATAQSAKKVLSACHEKQKLQSTAEVGFCCCGCASVLISLVVLIRAVDAIVNCCGQLPMSGLVGDCQYCDCGS